MFWAEDIDRDLPPFPCIYIKFPEIRWIHTHRRILRLFQHFPPLPWRHLKNQRGCTIRISNLHSLRFQRYSVFHCKIPLTIFLLHSIPLPEHRYKKYSLVIGVLSLNNFFYQLPRNAAFPEKRQRLIKFYPYSRINLSRQGKIFFIYNCLIAQHKHLFLVIRVTFYVF